MEGLEYLKIALGNNMNVSTLTPLAIAEIMEDYHQKQIKLLDVGSVLPETFYVVSRTFESREDLAQLSVGLDSYVDALNFKNSEYNIKKYPNAFIVSSLKEVK